MTFDLVGHRGKMHLTRAGEETTLCGRNPPNGRKRWLYRIAKSADFLESDRPPDCYCQRCVKAAWAILQARVAEAAETMGIQNA